MDEQRGLPAARSSGKPLQDRAIKRLAIATLTLGGMELAAFSVLVAAAVLDKATWFGWPGVADLFGLDADAVMDDLPLDESPLFLVSGGLKLAATVGLILQRRWARGLTLILGVAAGVLAIGVPVAALGEVLSRRLVNPGSVLRRGVLCFIGGATYIAYCGLVWLSLWRKDQSRVKCVPANTVRAAD